jgi:hypothetical protein
MKAPQTQTARHSAACGATLIEFLAFVVLIWFVLAGAHLAHSRYGSWLGSLLGGVVGLLSFLLAVLALALVKDGFGGMPPLPRCRNGCCRGPGTFRGYGDYEIVQFGDQHYRVCRCGIRHKRSGNRFVIVNADGTEIPYLVWRPFRGWFPDGPGGGQQAAAPNGGPAKAFGNSRADEGPPSVS